jgi:hypothetical protein
MIVHDWPLYANLLAVLCQKSFGHVHRAAFRLDVADETLIIAVFGNDDYRINARIQKEVDGFRQDIVETGNRELAFGLSPDGRAWALVIRPDLERNRTAPAKVFHMEMLKSFTEDLVTGNRSTPFPAGTQKKRWSVNEYFPAQ